MASCELVSLFSDYYKDVNGIRPRWYDFDSISDKELEAEIKYLDSEVLAQKEKDSWWETMDAEESKVHGLYFSETLPYEEFDS